MRRALPLIHCLSDDIRAKLLGKITDVDSVPNVEWKDWLPEFILDNIDYDRFMRQKPHHPRQVK